MCMTINLVTVDLKLRVLEEGEETRLKGDNKVKGEEAVCWEED